MNKKALLSAAAHTLGRRIGKPCLDFSALILLTGAILALGIATSTLAAIPLWLPDILAKGKHPLGSEPASAWILYALGAGIAYVLILAWGIRDGHYAALKPTIITRFEALLLCPFPSGGEAFVRIFDEPEPRAADMLRQFPKRVVKALLLGLSAPLQAAALAFVLASSLAVLLRRGLAARTVQGPKPQGLPATPPTPKAPARSLAARALDAASRALEDLARQSPEVLARHEARALGEAAARASLSADLEKHRL